MYLFVMKALLGLKSKEIILSECKSISALISARDQ